MSRKQIELPLKDGENLSERKDQVGIDGEKNTEGITLKVFFGKFVFSSADAEWERCGWGTSRVISQVTGGQEKEKTAIRRLEPEYRSLATI